MAAEPYGRLEKAPRKKSLGTLNTTLSGMGCTLSFKPWSSDEEEVTMTEGEVSRENKEGVR